MLRSASVTAPWRLARRPVGSQHERHVGITGRCGQAEQVGEQELARDEVGEVGAPHHLAYLLGGVVNRHGELIGGCAVVAADDEVVYLLLATA